MKNEKKTEYFSKKNNAKKRPGSMKNPFFKRVVPAFLRLFPSYLLCFVPFLFFGTWNDIKLILWKIAVVGTGLLIFHHVRKSMFPYIDLLRSFERVFEARDKSKRLPLALVALSQSLLIAAMAVSIIFAVAGGI